MTKATETIIEGWPVLGDGGTGCIEGDSGLGVEGFGELR